MMMLLDLMGAAQPTFQNFFDETSPAYYRLNNLEDNLRKSGLLKREEPDQMFVDNTGTSHIEDDHIPFLERGNQLNFLLFVIILMTKDTSF